MKYSKKLVVTILRYTSFNINFKLYLELCKIQIVILEFQEDSKIVLCKNWVTFSQT